MRNAFLVVALGLNLALAARADEKGGARALFDETAQAYRALKSYADHGAWTLELTLDGKPVKQSMPMAVRFERPNRLAIEAGPVRVFSDGARMTTVVEPLKRYTLSAAPEKLRLEAFDNNSVGAVLLSGPAGFPLRTVLSLLSAEDAAGDILGGSSGLEQLPDQTRSGSAYRVLAIHFSDAPDTRLEIDPATKLLKRIELVPHHEEDAALPGTKQAGKVAIAWDAGAIETKALPASAFTFEPPAGFSRVPELSSLRKPEDERKSPLEELLGQDAPDFTLTALDGRGKTKELRKADLAGKVVLIDFWATWCPPCMAELPEMQTLVDDLAKKHPKDVVVIALSIDTDPGAQDDVRALVEKTLAGKQLKLAEGPVSLVALDPSQTIPKLFHVSGIPTAIILDGKGTVQAVHVGFRADLRDSLASDIDALLEGRSLVEKGNKPKPAQAPDERR